MPLLPVVPFLPLTNEDPPIVDFALDAAADRLTTISDEGDIEDTDNGGGFWVGTHAANSEVANTAPLRLMPLKN